MAGQVEGNYVVIVTQGFDLSIPIGEVVANRMYENDGLWLFRARSSPVQTRITRYSPLRLAHGQFDGTQHLYDS